VAVRSIIDVVVNTGAFQRFASLYQRYQQTLPAAVASWQQINAKVTSAASSMKTMAVSSSSVSSAWRSIASHTANVASSLKSATDSLLRWTSISTIVGGLLGVGSLFGLDRLALGVGSGRREATGVGTTYGQQTAFNLSYGRFVDQSFLGRVSEASSDPTKSWILRRLGATPQALAAGNSTDIARQILPALEKFAKTTDINKLGLLARALHYTDVISEEELKRLRASQPGELAAQGPKYGARLEAFKRTGATEEQYQSFAEKLEEAGETIKNVFVIGLQPVIPKLTDLSGALTNILVRFLKEIKPSDIELLATKIGELANYLGGEEFKAKLDKFISGMEELGDSLLKWGERLHLISSPGPTPYEARTTHVGGPTGVVGNLVHAVVHPVETYEDIKRGSRLRVPNEASGVPSAFGSVSGPKYTQDQNPSIGGGTIEENARNNFNNRFGVSNQTGSPAWLTLMSAPGASTPTAGVMLGARGANP
jgi:hypothetical protein